MGVAGHHEVRVDGLAPWLDAERLLGAGAWQLSNEGPARQARAMLPRGEAADLQARLRGLGIGGYPVTVHVDPPLPRPVVRRARTEEARRRRQATPGWLEPGARAEGEARYSLTPEALAVSMARHAAGRSVVDVCAGAGGNAVAFARAGCRVQAFEPNPEHRAALKHNLRIYGVAGRVEVRPEPLEEVVGSLAGELLFADPPWGRDYDHRHCGVEALPLLPLVLRASRGFREWWLKLPPSFDVAQIDHASVEGVFGQGPGDQRRVKFLWMRSGASEGA